MSAKETVFFTIAARNYAAYVRSLYQSLRAAYHNVNFIWFIADDWGHGINENSEPFPVVHPSALDLPEFEAFKFRYNVIEFATAIKPYAFAKLFRNQAYRNAVYLDPDIYVLRRLNHVHDALRDHFMVLTPHITQSLDDGMLPDDQAIMRAGVFNLGFLALSRGADADAFLKWWCEKLRYHCVYDEPQSGVFTDQKWIDLAPCFFNNIKILRHPGYNLAYWNLLHRPVANTPKGLTAAGRPVHFVHFSGINPSVSGSFSKHQNRFTYEDLGDLQALADAYVAAVRASGHEQCRTIPYGFDRFANGTRIPHEVRRCYRKMEPFASARVPTPFSSHAEVMALIGSPNSVLELSGMAVPLPAIAVALWEQRPDLQAAFDLSAVSGRACYCLWLLGADSPLADTPEFRHWLDSPALDGITPGLPVSINQQMHAVWWARDDLRKAFPLRLHDGALRYLLWCLTDGAADIPCFKTNSIWKIIHETAIINDASPVGDPPFTKLMLIVWERRWGRSADARLRLPQERKAFATWFFETAVPLYELPVSPGQAAAPASPAPEFAMDSAA
ncbi:hypothetical protein [Azospirillum sp. SYSU D00513]|uniref:hypothetical protein n=1 Tax=Azospirillum sp. SYSU D00513 TaxID=2812561 RepID=UPI001A9575B8|nr:hypothetical protein [Azospirillum sp. SYSU D00513]